MSKKSNEQNKTNNKEEYYTTHQVALLFYVTPTTIIKWLNEGIMKCVKTVGKHRRISQSEVDKLRKELGYDD